MKTKILYSTYDGILEPIGRSQIIPYLINLSSIYNITIFSFEKKKDLHSKDFAKIQKKLKNLNIKWIYLRYFSNQLVYLNLFNVLIANLILFFLNIFNSYKFIHIRSYLPFLNVIIFFFYSKKIIFDMRGFWPEEKIDRFDWKKYQFRFKILKILEKIILHRSYKVICLTKESIKILSKKYPSININKFLHIPTCSDTDYFYPLNNNKKDKITFGYLGTIDKAYDIEKVVNVFSNLLLINNKIFIKFVTKSNYNKLKEILDKYKISSKYFSIESASRENLNDLLNTIDIGVFYLKKNDSIKASFPTKISEFLSCNIPLLTNSFNEDINEILINNKLGIINSFNNVNYNLLNNQINSLLNDNIRNNNCRKYALSNLSLSFAVKQYEKIYK